MEPVMQDQLESFLCDVFKGKGFQKIKEIIQRDISPQKYRKQLLNKLDKVLKKELDKNEFINVSLLLKCIQQFCRSDPQEGVNLLLQEGLIAKMVTWFERTREFLGLMEPNESRFLVNLVEDFFDTALIIGESNSEGRKQLLESFIPYLGYLAADSHVNCFLRQEALKTLNTLLTKASKEERKKFATSEEMRLLTKQLAEAILDVGDYDIQVAIMEALFRIMLKKSRDDLVDSWFEDRYIAQAFREIKDRDFETDSRIFLNELNERLGDKRRVFSVPCKAVVADTNKLMKPDDDKLKEFWIDFNFGSESITFYVDKLEGGLWESVKLAKEAVANYHLQEEGGGKILNMLLKNPMAINKKDVTKIQIHFDCQFDVLTPLFNVVGKDKVMIILDQDDDHCSKDHPQQSTTAVSRHVEGGKDLVGSDSSLNISSFLPSNPSVTAASQKTIAPADATATRKSQLTGKQNGSQASGDVGAVSGTNALKTPSPLNTSASKASLLSQKNRAVKDAYEFEHMPDPASHEMSASYRNNLPSEGNQGTPYNYDSDRSWILDSQKKLGSKPADYTRKKTRVRSKLKVLPLSSPSSGSDHYGKKVGSSSRGKQRARPSTEPYDFPARLTPIVSSTPMLHVRDSGLEMAGDTLPLRSHSSSDISEAGASKKYEATSSTLPMEVDVPKLKRKFSDLSAGTSGKWSKLAKKRPRGHISPSVPFAPRKLFNSTEMEEETQEGHNFKDLGEDVFASKMLEEGADNLEVIAAFESFTSALKKMFWSRYKRRVIYTQNTLRSSEQHILALLNEIHQSRLNELEHFRKMVAQELVNLEKRTQFLSNLEEDTLEFWTEQCNNLNSKMNNFCIHQMQRIQFMDLELERATKNLADPAQNGKFEEAVDHEKERRKASVIVSD